MRQANVNNFITRNTIGGKPMNTSIFNSDTPIKTKLPNGLEVYHNNKGEVDFLYNEIFVKEIYFRNGISLKDGGTVLDIGANIGMFTLYINHKFKNCKVYCFEPLPPTYKILKLNTKNLEPNIKAINCGLSCERKNAKFVYFPSMSTDSVQLKFRKGHEKDLRYGILNLYKNEYKNKKTLNRFADYVLRPEILREQVYDCSLSTLSEVIQSYNIESIDLLKIDVEKSEFEVLEGICSEDWRKIKQTVMEVHDFDDEKINRLKNIFTSNGFDIVIDIYDDIEIPGYYNVYAKKQEG